MPSFRCLDAYIHLLAVCLVLGPFAPCLTVWTLMNPQTRWLICSPFSTASLPVAAHPALASSHLSHFLTRLTCAVLILLQGHPDALGPLWGGRFSRPTLSYLLAVALATVHSRILSTSLP